MLDLSGWIVAVPGGLTLIVIVLIARRPRHVRGFLRVKTEKFELEARLDLDDQPPQ